MLIAWTPPRRYAAMSLVSFGLAALASSGFDPPVPSYRIGEFTDRSFRAPYDFAVTDDEATRQQRDEAVGRSPVVVDVSPVAARTLQASLAQVFAPLLAAISEIGPPPDAPAIATARAKRTYETRQRERRRLLDAAVASTLPAVEATVGLPAPATLRDLLAQDDGVGELRRTLDAVIAGAYSRPVVVDPDAVWKSVAVGTAPAEYDVLLVTGTTERIARQPGALYGLAEARQVLRDAPPSIEGFPPAAETWLRHAVAAALRANAAVNVKTTMERRAAAAAAVIPASLSFRRNQLIIGEGQPVTRQTVLALEYLQLERRERYSWTRVGVQGALLFVALSLAFLTIDGYRPRFIDADGLFVYGLVSIAVAAMSFLGWEALSGSVAAVPPLATIVAFPWAALAMYTRLVAPQATVMRLLVAQALAFGLVWQGDARLAFFILASGWVGGHLIALCSRRQGVLRAGLATGVVAAPLAASLAVLDSDVQGAFGVMALAGLASGVYSAVVVLALGPVYELVFGHLTRIRLVELINYQHPLLRRLTEITPGTFQHSIGVGVLADAAARATGADPLLVRVAALYHDVGKTKNPDMFVENQHGRNPHDDLPPVESARRIIEHVPEGVRLLREHKLGDRILDFVREHHGTSPVHYFLAKAEREGVAFNPADFTYPGPPPRSLETLIVMLADQVEATSRSMPDADATALASMVDRTIERVRSDGQLDACPVTIRDLTAIRDALVATLEGMAHRRIPYPGKE